MRPLALFAALLLPALARPADEIRFVARPAPKAEPGKVLVTTYEVSWGLRDDTKATLGGLLTYHSRAQAEAVARRKYAESQKADAGRNDWTRIKFVEITATTELVDPDDPVLARVRYWQAVEAALAKKARQCNELQQQIAAGLGVRGLDGKTADQIATYLASADGKKAGWEAVAGLPAAGEKARDGYYVIGVITSEARNAARPKGADAFTHGHVIAVTPTYGEDWADTLVASANAGPDKAARLVPAGEITYRWERPKYQFFAVRVK